MPGDDSINSFYFNDASLASCSVERYFILDSTNSHLLNGCRAHAHNLPCDKKKKINVTCIDVKTKEKHSDCAFCLPAIVSFRQCFLKSVIGDRLKLLW